ncbi:MAG: MFS transporter [Chloroflexi bacterium]|nr:MFS transporter [Chloroflexota bacterium]
MLLLIEFLDEFVFGVREAAWPLIRNDLALDYAQVGILLGLPNFTANLIEPLLGILGDVWRRRVLVLGGGVAFCVGLLLVASSQQFLMLLAAFILLSPASGAFVSLSQATLMDSDPSRHEQNMARWTFAGSVGVVGGTLVLSGVSGFGAGWRVLFLALALLTLVLVILASRFRFANGQGDIVEEERPAFKEGVANAARTLKRPEVLRWLALLEFSNLMTDVLLGYLALYFVDVAHTTPETAALGVTIWTALGLLGDFLMIPLLERVHSLSYLRVSALIELLLLPAFLLVPELWMKFALVGLLGLFNAGWYAILQGRLYSAMPGQSGSVMAVGNVFGLLGGLLPMALGWAAQYYGLGVTMWLLIIGPVALLVALPRRSKDSDPPPTS